jgi:hypothetical protein
MSAELQLDTAAFRAALEALGATADVELDRIVESNARLFAADLPSRYPAKDGGLRGGIQVKKRGPRRYQVRNAAPHAHLFEYGTVRRFTAGTGAYRGVMPAKPTFVPWAIRARARMLDQVRAFLRAVHVPGFTGSLETRES